jgi:ketosteroid isomerase-like protein
MGNTNIETVQAIYEAFGKGDVETILGLLADDVDWGAEAQGTVAPWWSLRTKAEIPAFFSAIYENLDVTEFEVLSIAANDTDVMAIIRFSETVKSTGKSGSMTLHHWWRFRDGKVVLYRGTEDTALTAELLTP